MQLVSKRGTFIDFGHLRAEYIGASDGGAYWRDPSPFKRPKWDESVLHASDVGKCPRQVAYRLQSYPKKVRGIGAKSLRTVMLDRGHAMHALTQSALDWAGLLVEAEKRLSLPHGLTGSCEALFRPHFEEDEVWLYDLKTVMPNMLKDYRYDMPKEKDCLQLGSYWLADLGWSVLSGIIEYADRAGANPPRVCPVDKDAYVEKAGRELDRLVEAVAGDELPPMLPARYAGHYTKVKVEGGIEHWALKEISFDPAFECGYCEYHSTIREKRVNPNSGRAREHGWTMSHSLCKPYNLPSLKVAELSGGHLTKVKDGHERGLEDWFASARKQYAVESE